MESDILKRTKKLLGVKCASLKKHGIAICEGNGKPKATFAGTPFLTNKNSHLGHLTMLCKAYLSCRSRKLYPARLLDREKARSGLKRKIYQNSP